MANKTLSDTTWVKKAENEELTVSDLAWLNTIILSRLE